MLSCFRMPAAMLCPCIDFVRLATSPLHAEIMLQVLTCQGKLHACHQPDMSETAMYLQAASEGDLHTIVNRCSNAVGDWFMCHVLDLLALHPAGPALLEQSLPGTGSTVVCPRRHMQRTLFCHDQYVMCRSLHDQPIDTACDRFRLV